MNSTRMQSNLGNVTNVTRKDIGMNGMLALAKIIKVYHKKTDSWTIEPVMLPCGEPIDEEYIKEWKKAEKDYKKWRKNRHE